MQACRVAQQIASVSWPHAGLLPHARWRNPASKSPMLEKEGNKPDASMFAHVVYLAAGAILVIIIAALILVGWRSTKKNTPPFTKHPVSRLVVPTSAARAV